MYECCVDGHKNLPTYKGSTQTTKFTYCCYNNKTDTSFM